MAYVLMNLDTGKYVAPPGSRRSYTKYLERAHPYATLADAKKDACDNEKVYNVHDLVPRVRS